jgi:hypothetical protein
MSALMTASEVISAAFDRAVEEGKIQEALIEAIQQKHFVPVLGEDFYDAIIADTVTYAAVIAKLKPPLAYMVKYYVLPEIFSEASTTGIGFIEGPNNRKASREELADQQKAALDAYSLLMNVLRKYLDDNSSSYPLYYPAVDPEEQIIEAGGIIFEKNIKDDFYSDDDDYWLRRQNRRY